MTRPGLLLLFLGLVVLAVWIVQAAGSGDTTVIVDAPTLPSWMLTPPASPSYPTWPAVIVVRPAPTDTPTPKLTPTWNIVTRTPTTEPTATPKPTATQEPTEAERGRR